jgi:cholestenol delta-isomerase
MAHPYYPRSLALPLYTAPVYSQSALILGMGGISIAVLALAWQIMTKLNPTLSRRAKATASWFLYCGLLHIHFEGYFIKYRRTLAGRNDFVANLWKEYALSDSRYLAQDTFVVGIEALTVVSVRLFARS